MLRLTSISVHHRLGFLWEPQNRFCVWRSLFFRFPASFWLSWQLRAAAACSHLCTTPMRHSVPFSTERDAPFTALPGPVRMPHWSILRMVLVLVSSSCCKKLPQTGCFSTTEMYPCIVLEARSPRAKCQQGWFPLEVLSENCFHVSLPGPGGCLQFLLSSACGILIPVSVYSSTWCPPLCASVSLNLFI